MPEDSSQKELAYEPALRNVLKQVRVGDEVIESVITSYRYDPNMFETDPWGMYNWLVGLGVRQTGAKAATERFFAMITNTPMGRMGQQGTSTPFGTIAAPDIWGNTQGGSNDMMQNMMMQMMMKNMTGNREEDEDKKMLNFAKQLALIKQITQPSQPQQGMGGMPFGMMGGMQGMIYEPAVGKDGRAILNPETNMPVYTFRTNPAGRDKRESVTDSIIGRLLESERSRSGRLEEKVLDMLTEKQSQDLVDMRRQMQYLQGRTSSDSFMEEYAKMKQTFPEIFSPSRSGNPEVEKIRLDNERWRSEQEFQLDRDRRRDDFQYKKWVEEKKMEHEMAQQSRQQIRELGATLREGITSIAAPMARAASAGMMEAAPMTPPSGTGDSYRQQPQQAQSDNIDVSRLDDQELVDTYQRAASAKSEIENAHDLLAREIEQRRQQTIHQKESAQAVSVAERNDRHETPEHSSPPSAYRHIEDIDPFDVGPEVHAD